MVGTEIIAGIIVLLIGGVLGAIGTYIIRPSVDTWMERRKRVREAKEAAKRAEQEIADKHQLDDQYILDYCDKLVQELRKLRILDMVQSLDLEHTYVRIKIQKDQSMHYANAEEMAEMAKGDPNLLFELSQERMSNEKADSLLPVGALRRHRQLVILGDPGAGKTTLLKHLCLLSAQSKLDNLPDFPIFVTLNRFAKAPQRSLIDFIITDMSQRYGLPQARRHLEERLDKGAVLLVLDGLDEVTIGTPEEAETIYQHTANEINRLITRFPKCPIVVTSRRAGWKGLLSPAFVTMTVLDFAWEDIQTFINNWFGTGTEQANRLQTVLSHQASMQALAANPLLLALITIVFERDLELPERRAKLYDRCVQVLLTEWDAHRGIKRASHFTTDRKRDLLEDIALHFHQEGSRYFQRDSLLAIIAAYLPTIDIPAEQASSVLDEICAQHGLLKEQATEWYGFIHLTLQEYFAAVSLDKSNNLNLALSNLHNPWWGEVILLLASMIKDATPLFDAILSDREDIFFNNLLLAGRCLAGTPRIARLELRERISTDLKTLAEDENRHWLPRTQAVRTLGEIDSLKNAVYLMGLVRNPNFDWHIRAAAAVAVGTSGSEKVASELLEVLSEEHTDRNVRQGVADALASFDSKSVTPPLLKLLSSQETDPQIRSRIARTLGLLNDEEIVDDLRRLLLDSSLSEHVAWYIGGAIRLLRSPMKTQELLQYLRNRELNLVGRWALASAANDTESNVAPAIIECLADESIEKSIRWSIACRLGHLREEMLIGMLTELYSDTATDLSVRASIGASLLVAGETDLISDLKRLMVTQDVDYYVRKKVAEALVYIGERDITHQLMTLLQDEHPPQFVRLEAANLLASVGDSQIVHQLLVFIQNDHADPLVRSRAADVLGALDLNGLISNIKSLVIDESIDPRIRGRMTYSLIEHESGVDWLVGMLERDDIGEEVFLALHKASQRANVRILDDFNGRYKITPI